ncbi:hypothetical protein LPJ61_003234, partial [Coemansia biformis]
MAGVNGSGSSSGLDGAAGTAELTKLIRRTGDALDRAMQAPNANYFAPHMEALRADCLELFRQLLVRNPYSAHRKDAVSKMWFRAVYPSIEQYRANIRQFEAAVAACSVRGGREGATTTTSGGNSSPSSQGSRNATAPGGVAELRRELGRWRARLLSFLQATAGALQRLIAELVEAHALAPAGDLQALDPRTLATHAFGFELAPTLRSELHPALTATQRAALAIVARLLSHLGDLARYRVLHAPPRRPTADGGDPWQAAKALYRSAIRLAPHRGQAHNQLAVIHGYERSTLDSVFAYYRALTAQYRFLPADANLRTVLDAAVRARNVQPEQRLYAEFVHLRYLFALNQASAATDSAAAGRSSSSSRRGRPAPLTPADEAKVAHEVSTASAAFARYVTTAAVDEREALMAHAVHLFELQQLTCLGPAAAADAAVAVGGARQSDPVVARLSASLVTGITNALAVAVRGSVATSVRRAARTQAGVAALLGEAANRAVPVLVLTMAWL